MEAICVRHSGSVVHTEVLRKISLAYPIKKETVGFFGVSYVMLEPSAIHEIEQEAKLDQEVLRMLVVAEPIRMRQQEAVTRDQEEGYVPSRSTGGTSTPATQSQKAVTNEELEKKLEEILG